MREILSDIRDRLRRGEYKNEEHVRLSLVCRLLSHPKIGWKIWDPTEVNTEFPPTPSEDKTRVDIALFEKESSQSVFIEIKAVGKMQTKLGEIEMQVRDYNKNNTALFSIITDGKSWRFYYSLTGGEFPQKFFKKCDLIEDDFEDLEQIFLWFFGKENIRTGRAEEQARKYLKSTKEEKDVQDCLPQARRLVQDPPYPSLPQAIAKLIKQQKEYALSEDKISEILARAAESKPVDTPHEPSLSGVGVASPYPPEPSVSNAAISPLNPDNPGNSISRELKAQSVGGTVGSGRNSSTSG